MRQIDADFFSDFFLQYYFFTFNAYGKVDTLQRKAKPEPNQAKWKLHACKMIKQA